MEKYPVSLMLDNVRSMQNIGSMFRTADAFKIKELILGGISATPPNMEISKTALGAEESVAWRYVKDTVDEVSRLKLLGWKIYVLEQTHGSIPLPDFRLNEGESVVLIVGNEVEGVNQKIVDFADAALEIPQYGIKHSLNVSVSAAIALYQLVSTNH